MKKIYIKMKCNHKTYEKALCATRWCERNKMIIPLFRKKRQDYRLNILIKRNRRFLFNVTFPSIMNKESEQFYSLIWYRLKPAKFYLLGVLGEYACQGVLSKTPNKCKSYPLFRTQHGKGKYFQKFAYPLLLPLQKYTKRMM